MSKDTVSVDELRALATTINGGKYRNTRGVYVAELDRRFDSQREADAAVTLVRRQRAGDVRNLSFQPRFPLEVNGVLVCTYVADFAYDERDAYWSGEAFWRAVVADAKGFPTPVYRLKKRLMRAVHRIDVVEL